MFTGIIEEIGTIKTVRNGSVSARIGISGSKIFSDLQLGDSVAVNGVCLTAAAIQGNVFEADVMAETLRRSNLGELRSGSRVNLERAMAAGGRFGGHIVSGHIDGTGTITDMKREENAVWVTVRAPASIIRLIVEKGSIAIDGISLTVADLGTDYFKVSIIPHTGEETILLSKKPGDVVNLENDVIGKYVERLMNFGAEEAAPAPRSSGLSLEMLAENGFI
ncbi:MAG: riboflavin synthase [Firmicutes bacterium]|nr:riboflavin synthase [Bacillota bacterium]